MTPSQIYIYTIGHSSNLVDEHLDCLESSEIMPDMVTLELPDVDDPKKDISNGWRELLKQSPMTGFAWYCIRRENKQMYENTGGTSDRINSEFEVGRRFANDRGIPSANVDLPRAEVASRYATWLNRFHDAWTLIIAVVLSVILALIVVVFSLGGLSNLIQNGVTLTSFLAFLVVGVFGWGFLRYGVHLPLKAVGNVGQRYTERIREIRDKEMYERILEEAKTHNAESILLVAGVNHFDGIRSCAAKDGVDCLEIESPAVADYDGDFKNFTVEDFEKLIEGK